MEAKENWWLHLLKNLITCESKSKPKPQKEKTKGWRWVFGRFMFKQLPTPPKAPPPKSLSEAREEQRKHALNVAKATATAAEAAVVAAQAAAEVVRLTCVSKPSLRQQEREIQNMAAIKIQTAFRGYIARKALRALKGVVKLQAIARGRAVRRRVEHLASNNHSQVLQSIRLPATIDAAEINQSSKIECKSQRRWTDTLCSKEEVESIYMKRQDAVTRRERMKQYSFSHRERQYSQMLEETMPLRNSERHASCPRRQWAEDNTYNKGNLENAALNFHSCSRLSDLSANLRIKPRNLAKQSEFGEEVSSPYSHPRRSFCHLRLKPGGDDCQLSSSSLMYPTYMAATESAKAKMRSMSTPRQRLGYLDTCFEQGSWSSYNGDSVSTTTIGKSNLSQPKSLSMEVFRRA